jgi:hypothetical protein
MEGDGLLNINCQLLHVCLVDPFEAAISFPPLPLHDAVHPGHHSDAGHHYDQPNQERRTAGVTQRK